MKTRKLETLVAVLFVAFIGAATALLALGLYRISVFCSVVALMAGSAGLVLTLW